MSVAVRDLGPPSFQQADQYLEQRAAAVAEVTRNQVPIEVSRLVVAYELTRTQARISFHLITFRNFSQAFESAENILHAPTLSPPLDVEKFKTGFERSGRTRLGHVSPQEMPQAQTEGSWLDPETMNQGVIWSVNGLQLSFFLPRQPVVYHGQPQPKERVVMTLFEEQGRWKYGVYRCSVTLVGRDKVCVREKPLSFAFDEAGGLYLSHLQLPAPQRAAPAPQGATPAPQRAVRSQKDDCVVS